MNRLRDAATEHRRALQTQEERLGVSRWLLGEANNDANCPVCGNEMDKSHAHLEELTAALDEVEGT